MSEPTTAAGKALLADLAEWWDPDAPQGEGERLFGRKLAAIEAEARAPLAAIIENEMRALAPAQPPASVPGLTVERLAGAMLAAQEHGEHNANCLSTDCPVAYELRDFATRVLAALAAEASDD